MARLRSWTPRLGICVLLLFLRSQKASCAKEGHRKGKIPSESCENIKSPKEREQIAKKHLAYGRGLTGSEAIKHFSLAIECSKNGIPEANFLRAMLSGKRSNEAVEDLKIACTTSKDEGPSYAREACMSLGVWSIQDGNVLLAQEAFSLAVTRDIRNERAWSNYGGEPFSCS
jgi:hypothetical protein